MYRFGINKPRNIYSKPTKLVYKVPMRKYVVDSFNDLYSFSVEGGRIAYVRVGHITPLNAGMLIRGLRKGENIRVVSSLNIHS